MSHAPRGASSFRRGELQNLNPRFSLSSAKETKAVNLAGKRPSRGADRRDRDELLELLESGAVDMRQIVVGGTINCESPRAVAVDRSPDRGGGREWWDRVDGDGGPRTGDDELFCGAVWVRPAVAGAGAYYISHLRESTLVNEVKCRQRVSDGGFL